MTKGGPLPLAEAREILRGSQAFVKGDPQHVEGKGFMTASDMMWEALLSLEDAAEFCAFASALDWQGHPRGFDNVELHERYGDGIVPWLATRLDADGTLHNQPWCVVPCLLRCASREAFALVWKTKAVSGRTPWGGCGDTDLLVAWSARHPEIAGDELERLAPEDARARAHLRAMGRVATPPAAGDVLALLDACAAGLFSTRIRLSPPAARNDVRLVAARNGADWGIAYEWIDGTRPTGIFAARVAGLAFGSRVRGAIVGAAVTSRPVPRFDASDLDARLGPADLALPPLQLLDPVSIIASIPSVAPAPLPSASAVLQRLAAALTMR